MEMVWSIFWVPVGREGCRSATAKLTVCVYAAVLVQCTHLLIADKIQQNLNPRKKIEEEEDDDDDDDDDDERRALFIEPLSLHD